MRTLGTMFRLLGIGASLALAAPAVAGEPVVLPDVTPGATSDFALAYMLQQKVQVALEREGQIVLTTDAARPIVGDALDQCADVAGCPFAALQQLPASIAVVIRVSRADGAVHGEVSIFDQGGTKALEVRHYIIEPGAETAFAREVAKLTSDVFSLRSPAPADEIMQATKLVKAAEARTETPQTAVVPKPAEPAPAPAPAPAATPKPAPAPAPRDFSGMSFEERLADTEVAPRHIVGSKHNFMKSNGDPRDWVFKSRSHAGRVIIDVRGGYGFGDIDRSADVRVVVDADGNNTSEWLQEGPVQSQRVRAGMFVGYAPLTWMDAGILVGMQYSQKQLSTGWRRQGDPTGREGQANPVPAVTIDLGARVRLYPVPVGIVKPYLLVGGDARFFDAFHIIDPTNPPVDYPDPPGGVVPGVTGGGGLMFDAGPIVGFYAEGSYTYHFGLRSSPAELGTKPPDAPPPPASIHYTVGVVGGVQFRI